MATREGGHRLPSVLVTTTAGFARHSDTSTTATASTLARGPSPNGPGRRWLRGRARPEATRYCRLDHWQQAVLNGYGARGRTAAMIYAIVATRARPVGGQAFATVSAADLAAEAMVSRGCIDKATALLKAAGLLDWSRPYDEETGWLGVRRFRLVPIGEHKLTHPELWDRAPARPERVEQSASVHHAHHSARQKQNPSTTRANTPASPSTGPPPTAPDPPPPPRERRRYDLTAAEQAHVPEPHRHDPIDRPPSKPADRRSVPSCLVNYSDQAMSQHREDGASGAGDERSAAGPVPPVDLAETRADLHALLQRRCEAMAVRVRLDQIGRAHV